MAQTRTHGERAFTAPDVDRLLLDWLNDAQQYQWRTHGQLDFAVSLSGTRRLRASAFTHQQGTSLALRLLPERCPDLAEIQTPPIVPALLASENGLILVTGATGCGNPLRWRRWWDILINMPINTS